MTRRDFIVFTASVLPGVQMAQAFQSSRFVGVPVLDRILDKALANKWQDLPIGELVGKGEPTLLATISTLDPIWFYCSISEVDYLKAESKISTTGRKMADLPVTLLLADGSEHADKGKFVFIDRAVDIKTGTLRVRVEFPNRAKLLRPGMFARIKVDLGVRPDSIVIQERAIVELQGKNFVWVIGPDDKATQRAIKVGDPVAGGVLILEGLKSGYGEAVVVQFPQCAPVPLDAHPRAECRADQSDNRCD